MKRGVILAILIMMIPSVSALNCIYDTEPYIDQIPIKEDHFFWACALADKTSAFSCFSYIKDADNRTVQLNPDQEVERTIGVSKKSFDSINGQVNVYFTDKGEFYAGGNYTANVECFSNDGKFENFSADINPTLKNLDFVATRGVWLKDNIGFGIGGLILLLIFIFAGKYLYEKARYG